MEEYFYDIDDLMREIDTVSIHNHNPRSGLSFQRSQKIKVDITNGELQKICYLVESHVPILRERTAMRFEKILMNEECDEKSAEKLNFLKNLILPKCPTSNENQVDNIVEQVKEMPKEWTIIQLTTQYNPLEFYNVDTKKYHTGGLHISVFNCGQNKVKPYLVTVDAPQINGSKMELLQELQDAVALHRERLLQATGKTFPNNASKRKYYFERDQVEQNLKEVVEKIDRNWLREWRCLLIGKYQDAAIEKYIRTEVDTILKQQFKDVTLPQKNKELLYQITKGIKWLRNVEVSRAVKYCCNDIKDVTILKDLCRLIKEVGLKINEKYEKVQRHPVIIVVDECIDLIPWEMLEVLENEPVTRIPSLHFAYFLFKMHEKDIEEGHMVIRNYKQGTYIVNPDRDLISMERRMMSFYKYWLPDWKGVYDRKPSSDEFLSLLTETDIFSYNGHGNGAHILGIEKLQKIHVKAVVLLFGCGSTRIVHLGPQVETYSSYHMYLISRCPCVLGTLWEVTDMDTDVLTTELLSNWIPSKARIPWTNVDKTQWKKAVKCDKFVATHNAEDAPLNNSELIRALLHAKTRSEYYCTRAAFVVRGLPVKVKFK